MEQVMNVVPQQIPVPMMVDAEDEAHADADHEALDVYSGRHPMEDFMLPEEKKREDCDEFEEPAQDGDETPDPTPGELLFLVLDWWTKHRGTEAAAKDVWVYLKTICTGKTRFSTFVQVKKVLEKHQLETMQVIDVCRNMCVAFYDPVSEELEEHRHFDRVTCPRCNANRYLDDGTTPCRVIYHFPYKFWLQDLLSKTDLTALSGNDHDPTEYPSGHIRRSDGYRIKVTDNPNMSADSRNVALSGSCDGVPFFKDRNAMSGWPYVLVNENCPPGISHTTSHAHLVMLVSCSYKKNVGNRVQVVRKDPKSLQSANLILTDELLQGQNQGFKMTDYSVPEGVEGREFIMKTVLLLWSADYPGLQKTANMYSTGYQKCHWCMHRFIMHSPGHHVASDMRRHLRPGHPRRFDLDYGPAAEPKPATRTHAKLVRLGEEMERLKGEPRKKKQKTVGIYGRCYFSLLKYFDMVWDFLPDVMHIHKGLWSKWLMKLFKGEKKHTGPQKPSYTHTKNRKVVPYTLDEMEVRIRKYDEAKAVHLEVVKVLSFPDH